MRLTTCAGLLLLTACAVAPTGAGAMISGDSGTTGEDVAESTSTGAAEPVLDLGGDEGPVDCVECMLTIQSMQSGTLEVLSENVFATAQLRGQTVYALGSYGAGRFIAAADSSLPLNEMTDCPLVPWLAGTHDPDPATLVFGFNHEQEVGGVV